MSAKKKVAVPSIVERFAALLEELNDSSDWAQVLELMLPYLDEKLDAIAAERRPEGIPVSWIRQNLDSKAFGCKCNTMLIAMEREPK